MKNLGFTIKELLMVIVVIGILCLAAIPQYFAMQNTRRHTEMEKIVKKVQAAIFQGKKTHEDQNTTFPSALDREPINRKCLNCFSLILNKGVKNPLWFKISETEYLYSRNGNTNTIEDYKESGDFKITYDTKTGTLIATQIE